MTAASLIFATGSTEKNATSFGAGTGYLTKTGDFTSNANAKTLTVAVYARYSTGVQGLLWKGGSSAIQMDDNGLNLDIKNTSGTTVLRYYNTGGAVLNDNKWFCQLLSVDLADSAKTRAYFVTSAGSYGSATFDPVRFPTYTNADMDFTQSAHYCFGDPSGVSPYQEGFCYAYIAFGQWLDFSLPEVRSVFVRNNKPQFLGEDGSRPTGVAPTIYLRGDETSLATNKGAGGGFTLTGTIGGFSGSLEIGA